MPFRRQPREVWRDTRKIVWDRDGGICQSPPGPHKYLCWGEVPLNKCHIDHIHSGKLGTNHLSNLRVLCPVCHALRLDKRHEALRNKALRKGIIPPNFRDLLWDG